MSIRQHVLQWFKVQAQFLIVLLVSMLPGICPDDILLNVVCGKGIQSV